MSFILWIKHVWIKCCVLCHVWQFHHHSKNLSWKHNYSMLFVIIKVNLHIGLIAQFRICKSLSDRTNTKESCDRYYEIFFFWHKGSDCEGIGIVFVFVSILCSGKYFKGPIGFICWCRSFSVTKHRYPWMAILRSRAWMSDKVGLEYPFKKSDSLTYFFRIFTKRCKTSLPQYRHTVGLEQGSGGSEERM